MLFTSSICILCVMCCNFALDADCTIIIYSSLRLPLQLCDNVILNNYADYINS